jgi:PKD repeat protein
MPISGLAASKNSPTLLGGSTALSATIQASTNVIYTWDFGGDESGSGQYVAHTCSSAGKYKGTVTATSSVGLATSTTQVITQDIPISGLVAYNDSPTLLDSATTLIEIVSEGSNMIYS